MTATAMTRRQPITTLRDEPAPTSTLAMTHDMHADLRGTELTAKAKTLLALDTAAELGRMMRLSLFQSDGACAETFKLWASSRNIAVEFVPKHAPGSCDVLRLDSDTDATLYLDMRGAK